MLHLDTWMLPPRDALRPEQITGHGSRIKLVARDKRRDYTERAGASPTVPNEKFFLFRGQETRTGLQAQLLDRR
jgi:hypothetical protein